MGVAAAWHVTQEPISNQMYQQMQWIYQEFCNKAGCNQPSDVFACYGCVIILYFPPTNVDLYILFVICLFYGKENWGRKELSARHRASTHISHVTWRWQVKELSSHTVPQKRKSGSISRLWVTTSCVLPSWVARRITARARATASWSWAMPRPTMWVPGVELTTSPSCILWLYYFPAYSFSCLYLTEIHSSSFGTCSLPPPLPPPTHTHFFSCVCVFEYMLN